MINEKYKYSEFTSKIIGCAMQAHKMPGNGFTHYLYNYFGVREGFAVQEVIYQRALSIELEYEGIAHKREFEMPIFYREQQIGTRRVDFLIDEVISVE
jgi:hypothetical protein